MTYIRFCAALALAASLSYGQNIDSSRIRYTSPTTGATQQPLSSILEQHHSVTDYGVICDGTTDNSTSLAAAVSAAIAGNFALDIPSGTCAYSTTLNLSFGVHLRGVTGTGFGYSALLYTGTGSAILYRNNSGNHFIYNPYLEHLGILVSRNAQYGIEAYELSQLYFNDVDISPINSGTLQVGFYCGTLSANAGCNIGTVNHLTIEQTASHAVELIDPAALTFRDDDFFNIGGADFAIGGFVNQVAIKDGWHEMQDIGILLDNSLVSGNMNVMGLEVQNSRFLFNNAALTNQIVFRANNLSGQQMIVSNLSFRDVTVTLANGATTTQYPFQINWSASPGTGSYLNGVIENSYISGIQNTGAFLQTVNAVNAPTAITFKDNIGVDQTGTGFAVESSGTGVKYQTIKNNSGTLAFGRNNQKLASTISIQDNDSTSGKTGVNIFDGPNQGGNSILTFYDASSNPRSTFYNLGLAFFSGFGTNYLGTGGGLRWRTLLQGTESGGNAGSNLNFCRYNDSGVQIDCPVVFNRVDGSLNSTKFSGQVVNTSGGYKFPDGTSQTSAGIQPSSSNISTNTAVSASGSKNQMFSATGTITVTLYDATLVPGGIITVQNAGTGTITINPQAGQTINGLSSAQLIRQFDSYTLQVVNGNWVLI